MKELINKMRDTFFIRRCHLKGSYYAFSFLNFSQCVVLYVWHKKIYKVTNLKVHSKGRYFVFKKIPFQELQRTARLDYKVVSGVVISQ